MGKKLLDALLTALGAIFALVSLWSKINSFQQGAWFTASGSILFFLLLFILFVFRRRSKEALDEPVHYLFAFCGTFLPMALQIAPETPPVLLWLSLFFEAPGIIITVIALATLGRGFGIIAANRAIKVNGLYRFVRHPLYAGEALWFLSLVIQNLSFFNAGLFVVQIACQIRRMRDEERLLARDEVYANYLAQVRYRLIPGIY